MRTFAFRRVYTTRNCGVSEASPTHWGGLSQSFGPFVVEMGVNSVPKPGLPLPVPGERDIIRGRENVRTLALHQTLEGTPIPGPITEFVVWAEDVREPTDELRMTCRTVIDLFAVALGASNSRQFLDGVVGEDEWLQLPDGQWQCKVERPVAVIDEPRPTQEELQERTLDWLVERPLNHDVLEGGILPWLLRAWRERDIVSRFIALFIPIEMLLKGAVVDGTTVARRADLDRIRQCVLEAGGVEAERLAGVVSTLRASGPSLVERFEAVARDLSPETCDIDVAAFRKFNRMRNELVHQGRDSLATQVKMGEGDVVHLQDLTERYVFASLFRHSRTDASFVGTDSARASRSRASN